MNTIRADVPRISGHAKEGLKSNGLCDLNVLPADKERKFSDMNNISVIEGFWIINLYLIYLMRKITSEKKEQLFVIMFS